MSGKKKARAKSNCECQRSCRNPRAATASPHLFRIELLIPTGFSRRRSELLENKGEFCIDVCACSVSFRIFEVCERRGFRRVSTSVPQSDKNQRTHPVWLVPSFRGSSSRRPS